MGFYSDCGLTPEEEKWVEENDEQIIKALANIEFDEWQKLLANGNELNEANVQKIIDYGWQFWDTYSDKVALRFIWGVEEGSDRITEEDYFDIGTMIAKIKEMKEKDIPADDYNWHQYADWAVVFIDFYPTKIELRTPFTNDNAYGYLHDDIKEGKKTIAELKEIVKNTPDKYYSK